jgi:hypothetical protein
MGARLPTHARDGLSGATVPGLRLRCSIQPANALSIMLKPT